MILTTEPFVVPSGEEVYRCQNFANPFGSDVEVQRTELYMTPGSHHMFAFYREGAQNGALETCSGLEFDRALHEVVPDLVILDDELPDGRGGDRARELCRDRRLLGVKVLVCTAAAPRRQSEITGWAPVVSKPFDIGEMERLLQATGRKRGEGAPG